MIVDGLYARIEAARVRAGLNVLELWLRYIACGGNRDVFDLDGYLQGLLPINSFEQSVLSHTVNEALQDSFDSYSIPLADSAVDVTADRRRRAAAIERLLDQIDISRGKPAAETAAPPGPE